MGKKTKNEKKKKKIHENYRWFSKFSPVEKLRIAKRAIEFVKILKNAK